MNAPSLLPRLLLGLAVLALAACAGERVLPEPAVRATLAPSGKLRVAVYPGTPTSLLGDPLAGDARGVGHDLGKAFAERLGVPAEIVVYPKNADALAALREGRADFGFTNATAARAKDMDFGPPLFSVEQGYLVREGPALLRVEDVDRPGVRVAVTRGSTSESVLSTSLRQAEVLRATTLEDARLMLVAREADAYATNKAILFELADRLPGSRVLPGRWGLENFAIAIPKGREAGHAWLRAFAAEARAEGLVDRAVARAGLRGTVPPER